MSIELRNWYLNTLGVTQYLPRGSVPVAGSETVITQEAVVTEEAITGSPERPQKQAPRITIDLDSPKPKPVEKQAVERVPVTVEPEEAAISFRLACWQPVDDLLVIDGLSSGEQPGRDRLQLLSNILKAIHRLPANGLSKAEIIDWPVSSGGPSDELGARTMLSAFLDARIKQRGVCWVLLMGESAAAYIGTNSPEVDASFVVGQQRELSGGAKAILVHSLSSLLEGPANKAETWQAIRFLAGSN